MESIENYYADDKPYQCQWGWTCAYCGEVYLGPDHVCKIRKIDYYPYRWSYLYVDKTEQAYSIMIKLIEKKIIPEKKSYKEFCELLDGIKESL